MADILDETIRRPTRVDGTRWVDHRRRAVAALQKNFPTVVAHLTELGSGQRQDIKGDDVARVRGMLKKLKSPKFLLHLGLYHDILEELSMLSLSFQRDDICLPEVIDKVRCATELLSAMSKGACGARSQMMIEACRTGCYRGVQFEVSEEVNNMFAQQSVCKHTEQLVVCLEKRFESFSTNAVFTAATTLDPKNWPLQDDPEELQGYGNASVASLLTHFHDVLEANGCDVDVALAEWGRVKKVVLMHYKDNKSSTSWQMLWAMLYRNRREDFPNFFHLIEVLQLIPLATAKVERAFSLMGRVKTDWRMNLSISTLSDLMLIFLEGPDEKEFCVQPAVRSWFYASHCGRRPNVQPHGKRPNPGGD